MRARTIGLGSYQAIAKCFGVTQALNISYTDPIVGMLLEEPEAGSSVGPTIARVLVEQFKRLVLFDTQFYMKSSILTNPERAYIEDSSLGSVLQKHLGGNFGEAVFFAP